MPDQKESMVSKYVKIFWVVTLASAAIFAFVMVSNDDARRRVMIEESGGVQEVLPEMGQVGEFSFSDQFEKQVSHSTLAGKIWVLNLMFTSCEGPCPMMSHHMSKLQRSFSRDDRVHFVSVTTDPATDTPDVLQKYSESFHAIKGKWSFLTGDQQKIIQFAIKSMKLPAGENPNMHSTRFVLIDSQGTIRGYYDSQTRAHMERLKSHIKLLADSPSA